MKRIMSKMKERLRNAKGFTLIEMIVVMAIIGILVALLAPNVATLIKDAQDTSNDAKAKNVMTTLSAYNTKHIKDGFTFTPTPAGATVAQLGGSVDDGYVLKLTAGTLDSGVKKLWSLVTPPASSGGTATYAETTVTFAGKSSGYLPANTLGGNEAFYVYLSLEGNVMGVVYVDGNDLVKAAQTTLDTAGTSLSITGVSNVTQLTSAYVRGKKTTDGKTFEAAGGTASNGGNGGGGNAGGGGNTP